MQRNTFSGIRFVKVFDIMAFYDSGAGKDGGLAKEAQGFR